MSTIKAGTYINYSLKTIIQYTFWSQNIALK